MNSMMKSTFLSARFAILAFCQLWPRVQPPPPSNGRNQDRKENQQDRIAKRR